MIVATTQSQKQPNDVDKYWEAISRIASHEAMCEERSKTIFNRLDRIDVSLDTMNKRMFTVGLTLLTGMGGIIITLALKL